MYTHVYMHVCILVCTHLYIHVDPYVYAHVHTHDYAHVYAHVHPHNYAHVYTHFYTHVYTHVCTQMAAGSSKPLDFRIRLATHHDARTIHHFVLEQVAMSSTCPP